MAPTGHRVNGLAVARARLALRDRVTRKPMTQAAFAGRLGIHVVTMSNIENGKANVSLELLERIGRETGKSRDEFLAADEADEEESDPMADLMVAVRKLVRHEVRAVRS